MKIKLLPVVTLIIAPFALSPVSASSTFLHAFERGIGGGPSGDTAASFDTVNWEVLAGSAGMDIDNETADAFGAISEGPGSNAYLGSLSSRSQGFWFASGRTGSPAPEVFFAFNETLATTTDSVPGFDGSMQDEWLTDAAFPMSAIRFEDLQKLSVYSNPRSTANLSAHFSIQTSSGWLVAQDAFTYSTTDWTNFFELDVQSATWLEGFYDEGAGTLETSLSGLSEIAVSGDAAVSGYGIVFFTGSNTGTSDSWVRMDDFAVTAVPEPSTYAAVVGLLALLGALRARRR